MQAKAIYKSKTIWFNVALPLVGLAAYKLTGATMPPDQAMLVAAIPAAIGNIILRFLTHQPLDVG